MIDDTELGNVQAFNWLFLFFICILCISNTLCLNFYIDIKFATLFSFWNFCLIFAFPSVLRVAVPFWNSTYLYMPFKKSICDSFSIFLHSYFLIFFAFQQEHLELLQLEL